MPLLQGGSKMPNTLELFIEKQQTSGEAMLRRNVLDILRCYRNFWDPYAELLQNSVDAINRRYKMFTDSSFYLYSNTPDRDYSDFVGYILIEVCPSERIIKISDNGVGIENNKIGELILPDCSDKIRGKEYGYKGKGLTYAVYSSDSFSIKSKSINSNTAYELSLNGLFDWVRSEGVSYPDLPIPTATPCTLLPDDISTTVEIKLADSYKSKFTALSSLDDTFKLVSSEEYYDTFINLLQTKTAIGNTKYLFNKAPCVDISIELRILDDSGDVISERNIPYKYAHPKDSSIIEYASFDYRDYVNRQAINPGATTSVFCLTHNSIDILIGDHSPFPASICLSAIFKGTLTEINRELNYPEELIAQDSGYQPGVYLSIDGMPTGIKIDHWEKRGGKLKRFYAIVDCSLGIGDELDSGRKGISEYRADQITREVEDLMKAAIEIIIDGETQENRFSSTVANNLQEYPNAYGGYVGEDPTDYETRLSEALAIIQREQNENSSLYQAIRQNSSLLHIPNTEEEVRSLFHELLAKGIIVGYSTIFDAANRATYDSALDYNLPVKSEYSHRENKNGIENGLYQFLSSRGVETLELRNLKRTRLNTDKTAICVEYKSSLNSLLGDITSGTSSKNIDEMGLIICWDYDNISSNYDGKYMLKEVIGGDELFGVTHVITITEDIPIALKCICLKRFVEKLIS